MHHKNPRAGNTVSPECVGLALLPYSSFFHSSSSAGRRLHTACFQWALDTDVYSKTLLTWASLPPAPFARLGELLPNKGFCEHHGDHVGVFLRNPGSLGSRSSSGFYHSTAIRKERPVATLPISVYNCPLALCGLLSQVSQ